MRDLTSLDIYFIIKELGEIVGGYIDKVWSISKEKYVFSIYKENKYFLTYKFPSLIYLSTKKESANYLSNFTKLLRKHITRQRITQVKQIRSERIIFIELENHILVFELIPPGNILLLDKDWIIKGAVIYKEWRDRSIRIGVKYIYPKGIDYIHKEVILNNMNVKELAKIGLGHYYANELLERSKKKNIKEAFKDMLNEKPKGYIYGNDVFPIYMHSLKKPDEILESFSKAIDKIDKVVIKNEKLEEYTKELKALEKSIEKQKKLLEEHKKKEELYKKIGEWLYLHYQEIQGKKEVKIDLK